jgi:large subunit ribosomal protein L9
MEIILLEQVEKLGNVGDIVKVKNGFARNLLIPSKRALLATAKNKVYYEAEKKNILARNDEIKTEAKKLYDTINGKDVYIIRHAGEEGKLYGSVMPRDISERLSEYFKHDIKKKQIVQEGQFRELGLYTVKVRLHAEYVAIVTINIARSAEEAKEAIVNSKAEAKKDEEEKSSNKQKEVAAQDELESKASKEEGKE